MFMTMAIARMSMLTKSENKDKSVICSFVGFLCVYRVYLLTMIWSGQENIVFKAKRQQ